LRKSEELYSSLFDNMLDGLAYCRMIYDQGHPQDFVYLNVNRSFESLTGLRDVIGKRVSEVIPGIQESDAELIEAYGRVALTGKPEKFEWYVKALQMWFSVSAYSPEKEYFVAVFEVITGRKRAAEEIQRNEMRLKRLVDVLQHPSETIQDFLDFALDQSIQLTGSKIGYIYHYHEDRKEFVLNTWSKEVMAECAVANPLTCYELDKTGIWGEAVRQRRPIIVNDFQADHPLKKGYPQGHVQLLKFMTVPILKGMRIVAVVGLANKGTDYNETDILQVSLLMEAVWKVKDNKEAEEALRESERRYRELCIVDDLTQLYNSRFFYVQLKSEMERSNRYGQPLTLMLLDVDDFKAFNDTYGHIEGDQVLIRLGQVIKRCLRQTDSAYRYGGEEFTIILPMTTGTDGTVIAERIRTEFKKEVFSPAADQDIHVTVSIGLGQCKATQEEMKIFVHRVDQLMYQGKKSGKDRVCLG
jgi:diguanylate cyclase (GGDEF)-like protein